MTNEEALNNLKEWFDNDGIGEIDAVDFILALNALEKQIPKKVELYKHNGDFKWENYPCPCCGEMLGLKVNKRYVKFCPNCGQSLQWEDINNEN